MKSAAVIGANSMLGRQLVYSLTALGVDVISIGRFAEADIQLDLCKGFLSPIPGELRADVIFHCAASFADESRDGLHQNYQINAAGCLWVLELADRLESSAVLYAGSVSSMEKFEPEKFTSYGFTKEQGENLLGWGTKRQGRRFCSLRFSQIYDTYGECIRHQPWFGRIIAYAANGQDINMPRSEGERNLLHVEDAAGMLIAAGKSSVTGILNVVHPKSLTYQEIAIKAFMLFGNGGQVLTDTNKVPFRSLNFPDGNRTFRILGVSSCVSMEEGIMRIRDQQTWPKFGPLDVAI
jgi:nucleoside-diphosphate-sugar epimerase